MAKLNINGQSVNVDDSFLSLPPAEQEKTVNEIAASMGHGAAPDKYQQAALEDYAKAKAAGAPTGESVANEFVNGATFGAAPTITAAMATPLEMMKRGTWNPVEGYSYAKAYNDLLRDKTRENHPIASTAMNLAGGLTSAGGLAQKGYTLVQPGQNLLGRVGAMAGEGAGYGALTGFNEGNGLEDRAMGAVKGGALGGAIGGALPVAGSVAKTALSPVISNVLARVDPEGSARARLARALSESGMTAGQVGDEVSNAANAGQGVYTVMDAMGNPGQRLASTVARAPGEGRTEMVNFLEGRQAGQGRRIAGALSEGFEAPDTAAQRVASLTADRDAAAAADYGALRAKTGTTPVWSSDLQELTSRPSVRSAINDVADTAAERGYSVVNPFVKQADGTLALPQGTTPNFQFWDTVKRGIDKQIAKDPTNRDLIATKNKLVSILDGMVPEYAATRAPFASASRAIDAVDTGKAAAMRGRPEDTIPAFGAMQPNEQAAFRAGYVDPLIESAGAAAPGVNKARPLMSDAHQAEIGAFAAPGRAPTLQQRLAREMQMFETRNAALGGSKTADNLADEAAAGIDPRIFWNALHGNWGGAAANALHAGKNAFTGNTPAVRSEMAKLLMARGNNADLKPMLLNLEQELARKQALAAGLSRGLVDATGQQAGQRR